MIQILIMDVDGTLTDGKIYMGSQGEALKAFDVKDGCGIKDILPEAGIIPVILTGRTSEIVRKRCEELNIEHCYQGIRDKKKRLESLLKQISEKSHVPVEYGGCAYIGDDILDIPCMELIKDAGGIVGCPADAIDNVKDIADFVSSRNGGNGAVREFIEYLVSKSIEL